MKPLLLPKLSQEALLNGATKFLVPCDLKIESIGDGGTYISNSKGDYIHCPSVSVDEIFKYSYIDRFITVYCDPGFLVGDEVYLQEPMKCDCNAGLCNTTGKCICCGKFIDPLFTQTEMLPHQSRYKCTIVDVEVVKVGHICELDAQELGTQADMFEYWYNEQYGNYDENPYVFLYTVERLA
jgi:hypothetical protein